MGLLNKYIELIAKIGETPFIKSYDRFIHKVQQGYLHFSSIYHHNFNNKRILIGALSSGFVVGAALCLFKYPQLLISQVGTLTHMDTVVDYIQTAQDSNKRQSFSQEKILEEALMTDKLDDIFLTQLGLLCTQNGKPEFAFQCYEILHLRNHTKFRTNSDLKIETNAQQGKAQNQQQEKVDVNDVLESVQ